MGSCFGRDRKRKQCSKNQQKTCSIYFKPNDEIDMNMDPQISKSWECLPTTKYRKKSQQSHSQSYQNDFRRSQSVSVLHHDISTNLKRLQKRNFDESNIFHDCIDSSAQKQLLSCSLNESYCLDESYSNKFNRTYSFSSLHFKNSSVSIHDWQSYTSDITFKSSLDTTAYKTAANSESNLMNNPFLPEIELKDPFVHNIPDKLSFDTKSDSIFDEINFQNIYPEEQVEASSKNVETCSNPPKEDPKPEDGEEKWSFNIPLLRNNLNVSSSGVSVNIGGILEAKIGESNGIFILGKEI